MKLVFCPQITAKGFFKNDTFVISLQYLKNEESDEVDFFACR